MKGILKRTLSIVLATLFIVTCFTSEMGCDAKTIYHTEDIKSEQVMFVYHTVNYAWIYQEEMYLISADGTVKYVDLAQEGVKTFEEGMDTLATLDSYMGDGNIPVVKNVNAPSNVLQAGVINMGDVKLSNPKHTANDAGTQEYYAVVGTGNDRKLQLVQVKGDTTQTSSNLLAKASYSFIKGCL